MPVLRFAYLLPIDREIFPQLVRIGIDGEFEFLLEVSCFLIFTTASKSKRATRVNSVCNVRPSSLNLSSWGVPLTVKLSDVISMFNPWVSRSTPLTLFKIKCVFSGSEGRLIVAS